MEVQSQDIAFIIYHEAYESRLIKQGLSYDDAHKRANGVERQLRLRQLRQREEEASEYAYGTEPPSSGWECVGEMKWRRTGKRIQSDGTHGEKT